LPEGRAHTVPSPVLGSRLCPVCEKEPLQGEQTACSARCRRERSRRREAEGRQIRDAEILALLEHAERLEARAADLRAQARGRLGKPTEKTGC
jgi:predicted nucleic acid-binding Zn ribbon protein